jgi:hypothetical protein
MLQGGVEFTTGRVGGVPTSGQRQDTSESKKARN